ncbi:hypothetical protein LX36DRAFT_336654 [Colletotrichum falcatum]|nr:hypothetical protein LX36DRAFT_336654 [Colletotrichum falcatum]
MQRWPNSRFLAHPCPNGEDLLPTLPFQYSRPDGALLDYTFRFMVVKYVCLQSARVTIPFRQLATRYALGKKGFKNDKRNVDLVIDKLLELVVLGEVDGAGRTSRWDHRRWLQACFPSCCLSPMSRFFFPPKMMQCLQMPFEHSTGMRDGILWLGERAHDLSRRLVLRSIAILVKSLALSQNVRID